MRIGLFLTGISFGLRERDWRTSLLNIQSNIIDPLKQTHELSIYLSSYRNPFERQLIHDFAPRSYMMIEYSKSNQIVTYIKGLELLFGEELDFIICTRFDILFNFAINRVNIDYSKFNVLFREADTWGNGMEFTTDNFFAFPAARLPVFREAIEMTRIAHPLHCPDLHPVYRNVKATLGDENMNFVFDGLHRSTDNPYFTLNRK